MKENLNRRYVATLALIAAGILLAGARLRPSGAEPTAPPPSETVILEQSVRREQAAGIGQYLATRAAELADQVVFLPSQGANGVRYATPGKVLTIDSTGELIEPGLIVSETPSKIPPAPVGTAQRNPDNWALVLGRSANGQFLWTAFLQSTSRTAVCNGFTWQELVLNATLDKSFAGGGAFDLSGNLLGIAIPCGGALRIVSVANIPDLLASSTGPDRLFAEKFGFRAAPIPEGWQDMYPRLKGLVITDIWRGKWADRNGLLPGDLIITDEQYLDRTNIGTELKIARAGRKNLVRAQVALPGDGDGLAVLPAPSPLQELLVRHGSAAERAGLRNGDRLVSILGQRNPSASLLSELLTEPGNPVRIVYERGGMRGLVEVPHE